MKQRNLKPSIASLALTLGLATLSPASHACALEPYISAVCLMALVGPQTQGFDSYLPADGRLMQLNQSQALYSLLGNTYGGSYPSNFALPDLRGRVVIGTGQGPGLQPFRAGDKGGFPTITLPLNSLPAHTHGLSMSPTGVVISATAGDLAAKTTLIGLNATTTLTNVTASTTLNNLTLKAYGGNGGSSSASGAALATAFGPPNKIYASSAPDVSMASGSVTGSATTTLSGNPTTSITGDPSTTITGTPTVSIGGSTNIAGASQPVSIMPPYLAMTYFIAINGIYPTSN